MTGVPVRLLSAREEGQAPDLDLNALLYEPFEMTAAPGSAPGLVVAHGATSRARNHADFCLEACHRGFVVLAPDFRGHGDSEGCGDGPLERDLLAAVQFLRAHPAVDPRLICCRGSSMGGFYGLKAAPLAGFAALVLICPAGEEVMLASLDHDASPVDSTTRWDKPKMREYFEGQDSRALAELVECPVLLIHARPDDRVPLAHSLTLAGHVPTTTTLLALESGHHSSAQHDPEVHEYALTWLWQQIATQRVGNPRD